VADLAAELGWPVLVVAANRLGVLNHTLLTVEAIRRRQLSVAGVVLVDGEVPDLASRTNLEDLRGLLPGVSVRAFPRLDPEDPAQLRAAGSALLSGGGR
jgi:dethiobiotin synthetase